MEKCEAVLDCLNSIDYIVDCDKCLNVMVCGDHLLTVILSHVRSCHSTLHVDYVKITQGEQ